MIILLTVHVFQGLTGRGVNSIGLMLLKKGFLKKYRSLFYFIRRSYNKHVIKINAELFLEFKYEN